MTAARAVTLRPPWGAAVIWGGKREEHRDWRIRPRLIWIHSGLDYDDDAPAAAVQADADHGRPRGLIIGSVRVTGVRSNGESRWVWQLADPRPLAVPVPCRGLPGLWLAPEELGLQAGAHRSIDGTPNRP